MKHKKMVMMIEMLVVLASFVLVVSCSTLVPVYTSAQFPADGNKYVVLGRVQYNGKLDGAGGGYTKLLEIAKAKYPNADDVVNIVVDAKYRRYWFHEPIMRYVIISGVAIDYVEVK